MLFLTSSTVYPHKLDNDKESELLKKDHGFVVIDFSDNDIFSDNMKYDLWGNQVNTEWGCEIKINDNYYFKYGFKSKEKYKMPVPAGHVNIIYTIDMSTRLKGTYYELTSGTGRFNTADALNLDIKKDSTVYLKIIRIGNFETVFGCVGQGAQLVLPWSKTYQRVAFKVEKVDDIKPGGLNKSESK